MKVYKERKEIQYVVYTFGVHNAENNALCIDNPVVARKKWHEINGKCFLSDSIDL